MVRLRCSYVVVVVFEGVDGIEVTDVLCMIQVKNENKAAP